MTNKPKDYTSAQEELQEILELLKTPSLKIDELKDKVSRAKELLEWSKEELRKTQREVEDLMQSSTE